MHFNDMLLLDPVVIGIGLLVIVYIYLQHKFSYWRKRGVPYVEPNYLFGNFGEVLFQRSSVGQFFQKIYDKGAGKPFIGFYVFGKPCLVLRDPEIIKQILVKDFNIFFDRQVSSNEKSDPLAKNLFLLKGESWKYLRYKLTPTFTTFRIKQMFPLMLNCGNQLAQCIQNTVNTGKIAEMRETAGRYATDIISTCAFGIESNCLLDPKAEFRQFGRQIFDFTTYRSFEFTSMFMLPSFVKYFNVTFFSSNTTVFLRKVFWNTMKEREENNIKRNDFMDLLLQLKNTGQVELDNTDDEVNVNNIDKIEKDVFEFKDDYLVAQAAIFFTAGFESNASTSSFTLFHLAKKPHLQDKLRAEILQVLGKHNGKITYDAIKDMEYLHMVVSETLRKYPPLPLLDRVPNRDYKIPGTDIVLEKNTPVYIPLLGIHNDPTVWTDPDDYNPERFNENNKKVRHPFMYLPFGEGPKYCLGKGFGLLATKMGLVNILSQFEVSTCESTPESITLNPRALILAPKGGIPLQFSKIKT